MQDRNSVEVSNLEWYRLRIAGVKDSNIRVLAENFENYNNIFELEKFYLNKNYKISYDEIEKIYDSKKIDLNAEVEKLNEKGIRVLFIKDKEYPEELRNIAQPPVFLYYIGDVTLLKERKIAVVGTRKMTSYGRVACENIVNGLVESKIVTVSGLAVGIDGVCHKRTLDKQGKTIAVVGSGLDIIYPQENEKIWKQVAKDGLLISEYPLGTEPFYYNFPLRNRIIVGLANGVLVVESQKRGGSLITAELALDEGREVFAIPGDIFSPSSEGCNNLIKNCQAKLTISVEDILTEFGWAKSGYRSEIEIELTDYEQEIYDILEREKSLDEIMLDTQLKTGEVLSILMDLEAKKVVVSVAGGKYRRKN